MALKLYIEEVGPKGKTPLETEVNLDTGKLEVNGEHIFLEEYSFISHPQYRDGHIQQ